jgi:hypothetical protein
MRRPRKRFAVCIMLAAIALLALPPVHWRLYGLVMGEPFWLGRPTAYWRQVLMGLEVTVTDLRSGPGSHVLYDDDDKSGLRWYDRLRLGDYDVEFRWPAAKPLNGWVDKFRQLLGLPKNGGRQPIAEAAEDPDAVSVLAALLGDPAPAVRAFAANELGNLGVSHRELGPEITRALESAVADPAKIPRPAQVRADWQRVHDGSLARGSILPTPLRTMTVGDVAANSMQKLKRLSR